HLHCQVGHDITETLGQFLSCETATPDKGNVRGPNIATGKAETSARLEDVSQATRLDDAIEPKQQVDTHLAVTASRRAHADLAVDELILPAVVRRPEKVGFRR